MIILIQHKWQAQIHIYGYIQCVKFIHVTDSVFVLLFSSIKE